MFKGFVIMDTKEDSFITLEGKMVWDSKEECIEAIHKAYPEVDVV